MSRVGLYVGANASASESSVNLDGIIPVKPLPSKRNSVSWFQGLPRTAPDFAVQTVVREVQGRQPAAARHRRG